MTTRVVHAEAENGRALTVAPANRNEIAAQPESGALIELTVEELVARHTKIKRAINEVLTPDVDFGIIPGTSRKDAEGKELAKPSLYKSGAEKISTLFCFDPQFDNTLTYDGDHLTVTSGCVLYHIPTARRVGSGSGLCSTKESKYAFRTKGLTCPTCGLENIRKSNDGKGWYCWAKRGGCGGQWPNGDARIEGQERGMVANDKLPDSWNTVLKMAEKRSHVAAIIRATGASEFVTQDLEDMDEEALNSIIRRGEQILKAREEGAGTGADTKKAGTTSSKDEKGSQTGSKGAKKGASEGKGGAANGDKGDTPPAGDVVTDEEVAEMTMICEVLESDPEDILAYYKVKSFKEMTPGKLAHFRKSSEQAAERDKKDLPALLAEKKAAKKG
jgi:hypothetical protein